MAQSNMFILPDIITFCQAPKPVSPHYEQVATEAKQWLSDGVHIEEPVVENLLASNVGLLVCSTYPGAGLAELRACTDFINMCYSLDDLAEEVDHHMMEAVSRSVIGSMREPHTFKSMDMFGTMTRDVYKRILLTASPGTNDSIIKAMDSWRQSLVQQTIDRTTGVLPTVDDYIVSRRDNSGCKLFFSLIKYAYKLDIPDEVIAHPAIAAIEEAANDFKTWCNDLLSFNVEQSKGQTCNMITVVMHQDNLDVQAAVDFVWAKAKEAHERFTENKKGLPSWDEKTDKDVAVYIDGLMDWMVGYVHWSFKSERYFGKGGSEVKETRVVKILPKHKTAALTHLLASNVPAVPGLSEVPMPLLGSAQVPVGFAQA